MVAELNYLAYGGVVVLGAMSPGPDFVIVTKHATTGRRPGLAAAAGIAGGMAVNTAAALIGLGAVFLASPTLYAVVRVLAALYLAYLGVRALWAVRPASWRRRPAVADASAEVATQLGTIDPASDSARDGVGAARAPVGTATRTGPARAWSAFRQGLFTNFLNPKVVIFLLTLTPQFMPTNPPLVDRIGIFVVSVVAVLLWFGALALTVSLFARFLQRPRVNTVITAVTGVALLAIGINIAVATI